MSSILELKEGKLFSVLGQLEKCFCNKQFKNINFLDPSINPSKMEMYADPSARGGVLEPEAIVEIKYRAR